MNEERSLRGSTGHLDLEELGALLEGKLGAEAARRLREHIAGCEDCYELYVISAEALEDLKAAGVPEPAVPVPALAEGNVRLFRPAAESKRRLRNGGQLLAYAAMAVLAVLTGFLIHRQSTPAAGPTLAEIVDPLRDEDAQFVQPLPAKRSATAGEQHRLAFGLGVTSVQLALQEQAGRREEARATLDTMRSLWGSLGVEEVSSPFGGEPGAALERLEELRRENVRKAYFDPDFFDLGVWTEAGRLAAAGGNAEYFQGGYHRDELEKLLGGQVDPDLEPKLRTIEKGGPPDRLLPAFEDLRRTYDPG